MTRILITGMSGVGKSAVIAALRARGYRAVDADEDGIAHAVPAAAGEITGPGGGVDWVWREELIGALLASEFAGEGWEDGPLFVGGTSPNQGMFYPRFDRIVLLTAPAETMAARLAARTSNPFGKDPGELARALALKAEIEPLLRRGATDEIETTAPLDEVVAEVLRIAGV